MPETTVVRLADVAPRLAAGRDALMAERLGRSHQRSQLRERVLHLQWLVAHRELQIIRAMRTGNGRYLAHREQKLAEGKAELARAERRLAELERKACVEVPAHV